MKINKWVKEKYQIYQISLKEPSQKSMDQLILEHIPLVKYIAQRLSIRCPPHIDSDDLTSSGILGLLDAVEKFDPEKDTKFKTYAEFRIRGAILEYIRSFDPLPRSTRAKIKRLEDAYLELERKNKRPADDDEVAAFLGLSMDEYYAVLRLCQGISFMSLDEKEDQSIRVEGIGKDPFFLMELKEKEEVTARAIDELPIKERMVVSLYYFEELSMKEIAKVMKITESRVSQIHTKAILRLRGKLRELNS